MSISPRYVGGRLSSKNASPDFTEGSKGFRDERACEFTGPHLASLPLTYITYAFYVQDFISMQLLSEMVVKINVFLINLVPLCCSGLVLTMSPRRRVPRVTWKHDVRGNGDPRVSNGAKRLIPRNGDSDVACDSSPATESRTPVESP